MHCCSYIFDDCALLRPNISILYLSRSGLPTIFRQQLGQYCADFYLAVDLMPYRDGVRCSSSISACQVSAAICNNSRSLDFKHEQITVHQTIHTLDKLNVGISTAECLHIPTEHFIPTTCILLEACSSTALG